MKDSLHISPQPSEKNSLDLVQFLSKPVHKTHMLGTFSQQLRSIS